MAAGTAVLSIFLCLAFRSVLCGNPSDLLNIYIIPHTHDDVGWLNTVDGYYVNNVQFILDSAITALQENPARKFTYVEIAYFKRWWDEQSDAQKAIVQQLVDNGQLDFNLGGWCMNDEAVTHYDREINQMTEGHQFLLKNLGFNARPTVGWHVDPFGHSSVTPTMWSDMGFDSFSLNRIDYRIKDEMAQNQGYEFIWRGSTSLGTQADIWVHVLDSFYCTPSVCGYDGDMVVNNDPNLPTYPVDVGSQAVDFVNYARSINQYYPHQYVLIPFGCDFAHMNAHKDFKMMDELINYVNGNASLNAKVYYGHYRDYVVAINSLGLSWDVRTDDFFPYASSSEAYWTGYYASHQQFKGLVRSSSAVLREGEIINTIFNGPKSRFSQNASMLGDAQSDIYYMRQAIAISQHHDAVTGTEKSFVVDDYTTQINTGLGYMYNDISKWTSQLVGGDGNTPAFTVNGTNLIQNLQAGQAVAVVVQNSLGWTRREFVAIGVNRTDLIVTNPEQQQVPAQIDAVASYSSTATTKYTLYFLADLPALGFATFFIQVSALNPAPFGEPAPLDGSISNDFYTVTYDGTGRLNSITNKLNGLKSTFKHDLIQYLSATSGQASGAYVFRPQTDNVIGIGSDQGSDPTAQNTYDFNPTYSKAPIVLVTANGEEYPDTFAVDVRGVSSNDFTANAFRVDQDYWGQNLAASFLAVDDALPDGWTGFQFGQVDIGSSTTACKSVSISFSPAFASNPFILATAQNTQDADDVIVPTVTASSTTGATVQVCRTAGVANWGEDEKLNFLAWDSRATAPSGVSWGNANIGAPNSSSPNLVQASIPITGALNGDDSFLATPRSAGQTFVITTTDVESNVVHANVRKYDNSNWSDQTVSVSWLIFPRHIFVSPVIDATSPLQTNVISGPLVKTIQQKWRDGYAQTVRLFSDGSGNPAQQGDLNHVRITYDLGVIDAGGEVVTTFDTDIPTGGNFVGDANGLERRPRLYDPTKTEPVAGNFYPMVQSGSINGANGSRDIQFTFVGDRSHSIASLGNGNIQIMVHRRCLMDDGFGVGEVLNDQTKITSEFYVTLDNQQNSAYFRHRNQLLQNYPPLPLFASATSNKDWTGKYTTTWTALVNPLPANLHLLSLELRNPTPNGQSPQGDTFILLRLQNIYETNESTQYSVPVSVDLNSLFPTSIINVNTVQETLLTGNLLRSDSKKLVWKYAQPEMQASRQSKNKDDATVVTLNPREIKTYRINGSPLTSY